MQEMFSDRLPRDFSKNPLTLLLEEKRAAGADVADLTQSNPTRAGISYPEDKIAECLARGARGGYAPEPAGLCAARAQICAHYAARGANVAPENVFITASTSEAYAHLFKILCDPGDTVLLPAPSYPLFESLCALEGVRAERFLLRRRDDGWGVDLGDFERACGVGRVRAALFVHPNNPTGNLLRKGDYAHIAQLCARRGISLIVDEVFLDYADAPAPDALDTLAGDSATGLRFVLNGLSKTVCLPQLKLSWIVAGGDPARVRGARERLEIVNDTFLSCATPVQNALGDLLKLGEPVREAVRERVARNFRFLAQAGLAPLPREAGWYAVLPLPKGADEEDLALKSLREADVLVHPGFFYDFPEGFPALVLSLLPPPETFERGALALTRILGKRA